MKTRILISICLLSVSAGTFSQNINNDDLLRRKVMQYSQAEVIVPYRNRKDLDLLARKVSISSAGDKVIAVRLSPLTVEWFIQQKYDYTITEKPEPKGISTSLSVSEAMNWDSYPTYSQYDSIMRSFATLYPSQCRLDTIGTSINGRLVLVLKISDNAATDEDEPEVFYTSTMHGDETGGFILMMRLADHILRNYQSDGRIKELVDNLEIWINPLANPDGTYRTGNTITSPGRFNANNADLNRNFPDPFEPGKELEKETIDMMNFMGERRFVLSANFHSGAEVFNYPWDRWITKIHADNDWFYDMGRAYADTVHKFSGTSYMNDFDNGVVRGAVWYIIYGGRQDFATWELQGREVTIELDEAYVTPAARLSLLWEYNYRSLIGYLENALYGIHGRVLDFISSDAVAARIFIAGHDKDSSQVYSDTLSGSFTRFLSPGLWDLTFSARGYRDTTISNVAVMQGQRTNLEVNMVPVISKVDTIVHPPPILYPNPASSVLKAVLAGQLTGTVNVKIYNSAGQLLENYDTLAEQGIALVVDVKRLSQGIYTILFTNKIRGSTSKGRFAVIR